MATSEEEMKEAFNCFDTDHSGVIPRDELGTVIRALGKAPLEKELEQILAEAGEGPVDFNKFKNLYRKKLRRPQELEKDMRQAFRLLDNTGTGKLSEADLRVLLGSLGEPLSSDEIDTLLKCVEVDSEGNLKYDEFVDLLIK